jgi:hypothetical protein
MTPPPDPLPSPCSSQVLPGLTWQALPQSWTQDDGYCWEAVWQGQHYSTRQDLAACFPDWDRPTRVALRLETWLAFALGLDAFRLITDVAQDAAVLDQGPIDPAYQGCTLDNRWRANPHLHPVLGDYGLVLHHATHHVFLALPNGIGFVSTPTLVPLTAGVSQ